MAALLTGGEFRRLFHEFEQTAFRLETRERYYEHAQLEQFLAGERSGRIEVDLSYMRSWFELMAAQHAAGRRVERVRVVSLPPSDYTRYGLWLARHNIQAGEDIRYLARDRASGLPDHDFWLLDSVGLYVVRFGEDDDLLGADPVDDPHAVAQARAWREVAWARARPYREFVEGGWWRTTSS
jgi:hypothetical protein